MTEKTAGGGKTPMFASAGNGHRVFAASGLN